MKQLYGLATVGCEGMVAEVGADEDTLSPLSGETGTVPGGSTLMSRTF